VSEPLHATFGMKIARTGSCRELDKLPQFLHGLRIEKIEKIITNFD
jgi:hypothetical protein